MPERPLGVSRKPFQLAKEGFACDTPAAPQNKYDRMLPRLKSAACCLFALCASGCVSTYRYVETGHDKADYRELRHDQPPQPVRVQVEYQVNGQPHPQSNVLVFNEVVRVLQRTNVLMPVSGDPGTTLKVLVDDQFDPATATSHGLTTGLTEGMSGMVVRDDYHFTLSLQGSDGKPRTGMYRHAIITVAGRAVKTPPNYSQPLGSASDAFSVVIKEAMLDFLTDLQAAGDEPVIILPDAPSRH